MLNTKQRDVQLLSYSTMSVCIDYFKWTVFQAHWIYKHRLGGAMIWSIDLDDFSGRYCGLGPFPLTNAMRRVLDGRRVRDRSKKTSSAHKAQYTVLLIGTLIFMAHMTGG